MGTLIIFSTLSLFIIIASWRTIFTIKSHGFYRFFSWECMAWLLAVNYKHWFVNPYGLFQVISWSLLLYAGYLAFMGMLLMIKKGKPHPSRDEKNLFGFEKTTELIDTGVFKYVRHPLYSALIFVTWAIYLKNPTLFLSVFAVASTLFLYFTSLFDEKECSNYFGNEYINYMKRTKMFIPFVF